jgi:lipopolysaccharide transport system ATP-binding protein
MPASAVRIEGLGKRYRIGSRGPAYHTLRDTVAGGVRRLFGPASATPRGERGNSHHVWALRDVSLSIAEGEALGIIGRNGSGKSTLLKVLARITKPTTGWAEVRGRVGSLLEVGTGFHHELTGRENIYMAGAILGMRAAEIRRRFDEIVAFAGVERFLDTPVKRFSSGMYVRLAFAVAAHLEPEVLIVDEVLAVGDIGFQRKCLGKMDEVAHQGRTVLFVSHNMAFVRKLCTRTVVLAEGRIAHCGPPGESIDAYLGSLETSAGPIVAGGIREQPGIDLARVTVNNREGGVVHLGDRDDRLEIGVAGSLDRSARVALEARLLDTERTVLALFSPGRFESPPAELAPGPFRLSAVVRIPPLNKGEYILHLKLSDAGKTTYWDFPSAVRLVAEGYPTVSGAVVEYRAGGGVFVLEGEQEVVR